MCGGCKSFDHLTVYDKMCCICGNENPYFEKYPIDLDDYQWLCPNDMCEAINVLPNVDCRNCFTPYPLARDIVEARQTFKALRGLTPEEQALEERKKKLEDFLNSNPHWFCSNKSCKSINQTRRYPKLCHKCYTPNNLNLDL